MSLPESLGSIYESIARVLGARASSRRRGEVRPGNMFCAGMCQQLIAASR